MVKRGFKEIPLWILFLSVQMPDIVAFIPVFLGIDRPIKESQS
jgi:hypothetical protein